MKLQLIHETISMRLPVKAAARTDLCSANGTIGSLQLNYNQRPAGRPMEIISSEGTGPRNTLEIGIQ
jgi:hypothetical protein